MTKKTATTLQNTNTQELKVIREQTRKKSNIILKTTSCYGSQQGLISQREHIHHAQTHRDARRHRHTSQNSYAIIWLFL